MLPADFGEFKGKIPCEPIEPMYCGRLSAIRIGDRPAWVVSRKWWKFEGGVISG
jgi:hypothetical protein